MLGSSLINYSFRKKRDRGGRESGGKYDCDG